MSERTYTKEQLQVIEHAGAHAIVAAVAGSGKTETLIGRVRHLLRDISPAHIAVVMFVTGQQTHLSDPTAKGDGVHLFKWTPLLAF
ncbi:UvrD-helicase domain-containing protein [Pseudomonas aeruginosa]|uniref:UvrD-helicase domain-containing protein n=1 Tax=Pseudomonas aeruginosa TaxID=287 RepID=UPI003C6DEC51